MKIEVKPVEQVVTFDPSTGDQIVFRMTNADFIDAYVPEAAELNLTIEEAVKLAQERSQREADAFEGTMRLAKRLAFKPFIEELDFI